jgi:hypothetical protein
MSPTALAQCAVLLVLLAAVRPAAASGLVGDGLAFHIRTTDARLRDLIDEGLRASPTFRSIVDRLIGSDVIVHLQCDPAAPPHVDGRLTFASKAGGFRHLVVRLRYQRHRLPFIGLLAHELRHAVEVADTAAIVDSRSLAREYGRIGYVRRATADATSFDTDAAIDAGYRVVAEIGAARKPARRALASRAAFELSAGTELAP